MGNKYKIVMKMATIVSLLSGNMSQAQTVWSSRDFSVWHDRVKQGDFEAIAVSPKEMKSNYKSPASQFQSTFIEFKFSINGKDNELPVGVNHQYVYRAINGVGQTPLIKFGAVQKENHPASGEYLPADAKWKVRLDLRELLASMKEKGFYTFISGERLYKEDFKGVYVAGGLSPLTWDFDNLSNFKQLELKDEDGDGIYTTDLILNPSEDGGKTAASWKQVRDLTAFPQYQSESVLANAIYNMSLEEMVNAVELDSTFRTGKEWAGVWTRDISYSIILSMAYLQPQVAKYSLMRKVNQKKRIIQDTGTGGAWPVSTDRMIWAAAAWEIYLATGDREWLRQAFEIIKNSVDDDRKNAYDPITGMVRGESSFLDWREQTYPDWMEPADIFESECLGTNAVHYAANTILVKMSAALGNASAGAPYRENAEKIKKGINKYLWLQERNYYGQFLYGRSHKIVSPRFEALGEALAVIFEIADENRRKLLVAHTPFTAYGVSCIYPQIPDIPPYHNNAVWPFVQTYWMWAAAKAGNEEGVMASIAAIYRPAALFLTNKENFVAGNGDYAGTQINSSNMLWSLSGNLSLVHKVLFGIRFEEDKLSFKPFVPSALNGKRLLTNFAFRNAILNIEMEGFGEGITHFLVDGIAKENFEIPADLNGTHSIRIVLNKHFAESRGITHLPNLFTPTTPVVKDAGKQLEWAAVNGAHTYRIVQNGKLAKEQSGLHFAIDRKETAEYQVIALGDKGTESFASAPVQVIKEDHKLQLQAEKFAIASARTYKGFDGAGFVEISTTTNTRLVFPFEIAETGMYSIDLRYANGNGPVNTENKCAIRTAIIDGSTAGTYVLPQRGKEEWSSWGYSNSISVKLTKGAHELVIAYLPENENMNQQINEAMIDHIRLVKQ